MSHASHTDAADDLDCEQALAMLQDYLKHEEMSPDLERRLRAHLDRCRPCFGSARFEERFVRLIAKSCTQCCPDRVREKVLAALRGEELPPAADAAAAGVPLPQ
jgi:anti-sigma factor (TIGR02949 family)